MRAKFINSLLGENKDNYRRNVIEEFEKLQNLTADDEVYLWFEYELFCQINMWFCLSLLAETPAKVYRVAPVVRTEKDIWKGFGRLTELDLQRCFAGKVKFSKENIQLGEKLWRAYQENEFEELRKLSRNESECFPKLAEVCQALFERHSRPKTTLRKLIAGGENDFGRLFEQFSELEGIYGFGDVQVKNMINEMGK
jgi:hypothetical protein